ncbi:MAG TPA: hypothetical protein VGR47_02715 [Terracidiphilus sp.]|nr:hypothetical protein [Terracidiphilus sp.]HEV2396108.1 hypothetical protein [Candidatus Sulfotelmatobacter sp.]
MLLPSLHLVPMLALFQSTQLNLFERFLTQAVSGIDSTSITSGMQNVSYVILLVGFLWQVHQSALQGGDVRGLGTSLIKYVVTAVVIMNYHQVFTTINHGFVDAGNWVGSASGYVDLFQNWSVALKTQFNQVGFQKMWGLITGDVPGLLDALLILVAYLLYPIVIVVFGFFYIFYGSILYIFGPIVIALTPLGAANRLAKTYVSNVFIWNAWPVLYGGFGALLSAVQMGQLGQMLSQDNFLGALGNLEGSFLIGIVSIVYSLAIAIIPFVAKRIVSGDVGSTAVAIVGAAVTAITAGAAGIEGAAAGVAAARTGSAGPTSAGALSGVAGTGSIAALPASTGGNLPAPPQRPPLAASSAQAGFEFTSGAPTLEGHAELIRNSISDAMGTDVADEVSGSATALPAESAAAPNSSSGSAVTRAVSRSGQSAFPRRGPTVHRYNIGTWGAYHAARIAAGSIARAAQPAPSGESEGA